jgi:hypothetical protein
MRLAPPPRDLMVPCPINRASVVVGSPAVRKELLRFGWCPIASRFIDTIEDARSFYEHRLVGDHGIMVGDARLTVRFNPEETHLFTDERSPCPDGDVVVREGGREERCFSIHRARHLDLILPTIAAPVATLRARLPGGVMLFGPPDARALRFCVIVAPARRETYFVRTAYPVAPHDFLRAKRSNRPASWPPK